MQCAISSLLQHERTGNFFTPIISSFMRSLHSQYRHIESPSRQHITRTRWDIHEARRKRGKCRRWCFRLWQKKMFITLPAQQWMNVVFIQAASKIHNYVGKLKLLSIFRLSSSSVFSFAFIVDCISSGLVFLVFIMDLFSHFHYLLQNSFHL